MLEASPVAAGFVICALTPCFWLLEFGLLLSAPGAIRACVCPAVQSQPRAPSPAGAAQESSPGTQLPVQPSAGGASPGTTWRLSDKTFVEGVVQFERRAVSMAFPLLSLGLSVCWELLSCQESGHWCQ